MNVRRSLLAATLGPMILMPSIAASATAETMLAVGPRATLVARGVAADIRLTYTCSSASDPQIRATASLLLTQAVNHRVSTTAWGSDYLVCDEKSHTATIKVGLDDWDPILKPGNALVHAEVTGTGDPTLEAWQEVRLVRK